MIRVGDIVRADEGTYQPGTGPLALAVVEVGRRERHDDGLWLHLRGVEVGLPAGISPRQRRVLVRLSAVVVRPGPNRRASRPAAGRQPQRGTPEAHVPVRPAWVCAGCGTDWPCPDRRRRLLTKYADNRIGLAVLLSTYLIDAVADLPGATPPDLHRRFLGWTRYTSWPEP